MKVRIIPGSVALPHTISSGGVQYQFAPEAEVPDEYGKALIRTHPAIFTGGGKTPIDITQYTFREAFKKAQISDVVAKLSDEQKLKVFNFAQSVLDGKAQEPEGDGQPAGPTKEQHDVLEAYDFLTDNQKVRFLDGFQLAEEEVGIVEAFRKMSDEDKVLTIKYVEKKA